MLSIGFNKKVKKLIDEVNITNRRLNSILGGLFEPFFCFFGAFFGGGGNSSTTS